MPAADIFRSSLGRGAGLGSVGMAAEEPRRGNVMEGARAT